MATRTALLASINGQHATKQEIPAFRTGDTVRVHARIIEGTKERTQIFEGIVVKRHKGVSSGATFTVRKVSYNIGVERTFLLHSPRVEKIELVSRGKVRRSRLFYLRDVRGKASRIKTLLEDTTTPATESAAVSTNGKALKAGSKASAEALTA